MCRTKFCNLLISSLFILISFCWLGTTYAFSFSNFYFVGDSLTDIGNRPDAPVSNGGNLWSNDLAANFGHTLKASTKGGTNYAYSGATTTGGTTTTPSADQQITMLLTAKKNHLDSNALYSVFIGANDFLDAPPANLPKVAVTTPALIAANLTRLHKAGSRYLMVLNLPDLGDIPHAKHFSGKVQKMLDDLTNFANLNLLHDINKLPYDVLQIDIEGLFKDILKHPHLYGITNVTSGCGDKGTCPGYLFYDDRHPTNAGHAIIADMITQILRAPNYYATLAETPVSIVQNQNTVITQQLLHQNNPLKPGLKLFFSGSYSPNSAL